MTTTPAVLPTERPPRQREWAPHIWEGCDAFAWARLLVRHRFAVHWSKIYVAAAVTPVSVAHTALRLVQQAVFGRRVACTPVRHAPLFIIGHWRSGTTLLHELLIRDSRHSFPTTYDCLAPHHFLLTGRWLPPWLWWMMPSRRPMDNMSAGWERPQEDEFAMLMLGQPSPYERIAFPNHDRGDGALDLYGLSPRARRRWQAAFLRLIRELNYRCPDRRLVLKSPPHTCRIPALLELFPDARFLHIIRDPYVVYPSTLNLWRSLWSTQGLQRPTFAGLEEYVLRTFERLYERLEADQPLVRPGRFLELRYEDLILDPIGHLERIYSGLDLGDFATARPDVEAYLASLGNYEKNRYQLTDAERDTVTRRWGAVIRRYGYSSE